MENAKKSVADLQATITQSEVDDEKQTTLEEVTQHIDKFQDDPEAHLDTLRDRLEEALIEFEAEHPRLAQSFRLAIFDLNNAGV